MKPITAGVKGRILKNTIGIKPGSLPGTKISIYTRASIAIKPIATTATIIQVIVKIIIGVGTVTSGNQPGTRASIGNDIIFYIYITCIVEIKRPIASGTIRGKSDHCIIINICIA